MRCRRVVVAVVALASTACGLFPDVSGLSGDGGGDVTSNDAGTDGAPIDASDATPDGPSDAGKDAVVGPCAAQHLFCDDFDQGVLGATWDEKLVKSGPLVLTTSDFVTPPQSLQATASSAGDETALGKYLPAADHTHIEFDARVTNPSDVSGTELDLVDLVLASSPSPYDYSDLDLQRWQDTAQLEEYLEQPDGGTASQDLPFNETFATWRHVALDLDFPAQTFQVSVDGVQQINMTLNPTLPKTNLTMYVGVGYVEGTNGDWDVFVDNVVVDQQ